jgi:SAM-dependent methyltransferase
MLEQEFDRFAEEYEQLLDPHIGLSGENSSFFAEYKAAAMFQHLIKAGGGAFEGRRILDYGCGVGASLPYLRQYFPEAQLVGADISWRSLTVAARRFPDKADFLLFSGNQPLPIEAASIDASFSACVFHHIPEDEHDRILRDLLRVVRPGGWLFIFEHNPLNPLTVRVVNACPFDENAVLIRSSELKRRVEKAGFVAAEVCYRLFFPAALGRLRPLESFLSWCPLGAQYYVAARRP